MLRANKFFSNLSLSLSTIVSTTETSNIHILYSLEAWVPDLGEMEENPDHVRHEIHMQYEGEICFRLLVSIAYITQFNRKNML